MMDRNQMCVVSGRETTIDVNINWMTDWFCAHVELPVGIFTYLEVNKESQRS